MAGSTASGTNDGMSVSVSLRRSDPGAASEFVVRRRVAMTVLDLLFEIQQRHDHTLAFRYSCRAALCGTCTVLVDGTPVLACRAVVTAGRHLCIEPLAGLPRSSTGRQGCGSSPASTTAAGLDGGAAAWCC